MRRFSIFLLFFFLIIFVSHTTSMAEDSKTLYRDTAEDMRLYEKHDMNSIHFENYLGDKLLMWEQVLLDVKDNGEFEFDQGIYLIDVSDGFKEERVPVALDGADLFSLFYTGENIYILHKAGNEKLGIRIADMSGKIIKDYQLKASFQLGMQSNIVVTSDGRVIMGNYEGVSEYDGEGNCLWKVTGLDCDKIVVSQDDRVFVCARNKDDLFNYGVKFVYEIDIDNQCRSDGVKWEMGGIVDIYAAQDDKVYFAGYDGIGAYDFGNGKKTTIAEFWEYFHTSPTTFALRYNDGEIGFITYSPWEHEDFSVYHTFYTKEPIQGKARIPVYLDDADDSMHWGNQEMLGIIDRYNLQSDKYALLRSSESNADLMYRRDSDFNRPLKDMAPFMSESEILNKDTIIPAVLNAYGDEEALYMLPIEFSLHTFAVKESDKKHINRNHPQDFISFMDGEGLLWTNYFLSKESVTTAALENNLGGFVNFKKGTCTFSSANFKRIISSIDSIACDNRYVIAPECAFPSKEERILFDAEISDFSYLSKEKERLGEKITLVGKPSAEGNGGYRLSGRCFGIPIGSNNPKGAFDFLEYLFSHYRDVERRGTFLANKEIFEFNVASLKSEPVVKDFFERETTVDVADIDETVTAISNVKAVDKRSEKIMEYVTYWTDKYYDGEIDLSEMAESLQKDVSEFLKK
ncbi:MAG: hypothetical protein IKR39_08910 [Lachnospiraceae bacterium]|nr:hypothetical protein [Lachnospiraceae bacterium]